MVRFCSPVSASPLPPPMSSMTAATAPVSTPQNTTTPRGAPLRERPHHDGGGVRAGDEEDADEHHHDDARHRGHGVLLEGVEELTLGGRGAVEATGLLETHRRAAEDGEPEQADTAGDQDDAPDELPDGTAAADARDEHADERRPGDPPRPAEDRPARQPVGDTLAAGRLGAARHLGEVAEEGADGGGQQVEDEDGRADEEHEEREGHRQHHVGVGEPLDALLDPGHRRGDESHGQHGVSQVPVGRSAGTGSRRTTIDFEVGVLLTAAVESRGTRTLVSGK